MFEAFFTAVLTEYGIFVTFLLLLIIGLLWFLRELWKQNIHLSDKLLETVENNTRVITQLVEKLDQNEHVDRTLE